MYLEILITEKAVLALQQLYQTELESSAFQVELTRPDFNGDYTLVVFPLARFSKKSPQQTAEELGEYFIKEVEEVVSFEVVKGFLNLSIADEFWLQFLSENAGNENYGLIASSGAPIVIEYSSPNTNKPLHLGHIRNNLIGWSVAKILEATGKKVVKVNLVNDRGIHICKSMLAWQKWGNGETPESAKIKGDHLAGKYYVLFDKKYKAQINEMVLNGSDEDTAKKTAPLMQEAQEMLRKWENNDPLVRGLWEKMNHWVYEGFEVTYQRMGVEFDKTYYESETYQLGKEIVHEGLRNSIFYSKKDLSVWANLEKEGLDEKLLLRSDGTSVYITQDLGTAQLRYDEFKPEKLLYVVGNEQNYHFDVLKKILLKLDKAWAEGIQHLNYGMVELPEGKMKSREGTVVDADDLLDEMKETARLKTEELGKTDGFTKEESEQLFRMLSLGALKYFILKVDPMRNMLFNPKESIDFTGNTGPFIQYTYARIQSLIKKSGQTPEYHLSHLDLDQVNLASAEKKLLKQLYVFPSVVVQAGDQLNPALVSKYAYELVKAFNHFYQQHSVLKSENIYQTHFRLVMSSFVGKVIEKAVNLLGIEVPERM